MWILPSRGRPENLKRFFDAYRETGADSKGVVCVDDDDRTIREYINTWLPRGWKLSVAEPIGLGPRINEQVQNYPNEPWYGTLSDDVIPRTVGWDKILIEKAGSDGMAYGADGIVDEARFTHGVLGGDLVRSLGWIILPGLQRLYGDNALTDIGKERGVLRYCPEVMLEHLHFSNGKAPVDETYKKPEAASDQKIYEHWQRSRNAQFIVCCVQSGNYLGRGAEYVNKLYDMVLRNMPEDAKWRFQCFTDDPKGLDERIEPWALMGDLGGWDNKIYLFKQGLFSGGERVIYFDLDTLITGPLDALLGYSGDFATLRDFYRADGLGPAVMLWQGGYGAEIWDEYRAAGMPHLARGDQEWLENYFMAHADAKYPHKLRFTTKQPDILQDLYPGMFASYKADCNPYPPPGTSVVCFHGLPRPHESQQRWVKDIWQIGGHSALQLHLDTNTPIETLLENVKMNAARDIPWIRAQTAEHDGHAVICGSSPSLLANIDTFDGVRWRQGLGQTIFSLNNAASILDDHGIFTDYQVILDARPENLKFMSANVDKFLLAAQCHPSLFDTGRDILGWVPGMERIDEVLPSGQWQLVGGGVTVGISAMWLAYVMGYRKIHIYGLDSSYSQSLTHAKPQLENEIEKMAFDVTFNDTIYSTNAAMAKQAEVFPKHVYDLTELGCIITVNGEGLIPDIAKHMQHQWALLSQSQLLGS